MVEQSPVEEAMQEGGITTEQPVKRKPTEATYKVVGDSRIPVSASAGKLWKSRKQQARHKRDCSRVEDAWAESLKYYKNDQLDHRTMGSPDAAGNDARRIRRSFSETENIVFSSINAQVPMFYARSPECKVTTKNRGEHHEAIAKVAERLVNAIVTTAAPPGVNLKPKARRGVVNALIMNRAYLDVGWTFKHQSSEQAFEDIQQLSDKLAKAKSPQEIMEIEGQLMALENATDFLQPAGPFVRVRDARDVLIDPAAQCDDLSDANWIMYCEDLPTTFLQARYGIRKPDGSYVSVYKPTSVLTATPIDVDSVNLFDDENQNGKAYGYDNEEAFRNAQITKVWFVWDRITRRVLMFADNKWDWPIWVWDDPYNYDTFFSLCPLSFLIDPEGGEGKGEVTYYLDQQDAINEINSETRRARQQLMRKPVYNSRFARREDVDRWLAGDDSKAMPIELPEGIGLQDVFLTPSVPSLNAPQLFDVASKVEAVNRITGTHDVQRGAQFKTNTTNQAISTYMQISETRADEKTDLVEDWMGLVCWKILQVSLQYMEAETVQMLLGPEVASVWQNMDARQIRSDLSLNILGGSMNKPNSRSHQARAIELGQVLGQFASVAPGALLVMLKTFERAFDDFVITTEDWQMIRQSMEQSMMNHQGGDPDGQQQQGDGGASTDPSAIDPSTLLAMAAEFFDNLDPPHKQAIGTAIAQGAPLAETVETVLSSEQQGQPQ
jgi:hypothetical protein